MSDQFLGEIRQVGFNFAPVKWVKCAGQLLQITDNVALYSLLGIQFNGDGRSTFGIPDLRGRTPVMPGLPDIYRQGQAGGIESNTMGLTQMPAHTHPVYATTEMATDKFPVRPTESNQFAQPNPPTSDFYSSAQSAVHNTVSLISQSVGAAGSGTSFSVVQPTAVVQFIIAIDGEYPSRS
ncbi:Phage Tail Collar Domain protein [Vibrio aerogenes CECT 7868]|uniref:Phage Tail Collar Domain protein n=1 Tax=Vibrio aerogenes CECT 7868 TaxID=1216006 RepID=A0A1M6C021_9VIBR|nr:tail fiber protein [Vibrio aerogenes]SHI54320.1 Phage Tail Collar Domain protein [Vibrio aerogenes CECT 7868]